MNQEIERAVSQLAVLEAHRFRTARRRRGEMESRALRDRYLHHVTLTTGHSRRSYRSEVGDDVIATLRPLLAAAEHEGQPIPGVEPACTLAVLRASRCLLAVIRLAMSEEDRELGCAHGLTLITLGVACVSRCAPGLWRVLTEVHYERTLIAPDLERPPVPWCAVRLEQAAALYGPPHPLLPILADLERCIAWAWLER